MSSELVSPYLTLTFPSSDLELDISVQIEKNEADWAVPLIACTYNRTKVALCPHSLAYMPQYWWTRYPQEAASFWILTTLFHPEAWMWTFLTLILITVTLKFASLLGTKLGQNVESEEVALIPFRWYYLIEII